MEKQPGTPAAKEPFESAIAEIFEREPDHRDLLRLAALEAARRAYRTRAQDAVQKEFRERAAQENTPPELQEKVWQQASVYAKEALGWAHDAHAMALKSRVALDAPVAREIRKMWEKNFKWLPTNRRIFEKYQEHGLMTWQYMRDQIREQLPVDLDPPRVGDAEAVYAVLAGARELLVAWAAAQEKRE